MFEIINFNRYYITSDMRRKKVKNPSWFKCPIDSPETLTLIHNYPDGLAYLGIWERLQGWAVRNHGTQGSFVLKTGAMSLADIAIHCGLPSDARTKQLLSEAIDALLVLGWLAEVPDRTYADTIYLDEVATSSGLDNSTGHDTTQEDTRSSAERAQPIGWTQKDGWVGISCEDMDRWGGAYPALDIDSQLGRMDSWLRGNPAKAKRKLWGRFITNWLGRSQERGGDRQPNTGDHTQPASSSGWNKEAARTRSS